MSADQPVVFYSAGKGRLSYVNCRPCAYTRASHPYRRPSPGTTTAGLAVQRRSCVLPACLICTLLAAYRTASAYVMPVSERVLTEWIALEHGVNLLQQWVTVSVTWNYSQHLKFISCFIFIAVFSLCIVCTIHVWCAFCHTIIKGYTYLLNMLVLILIVFVLRCSHCENATISRYCRSVANSSICDSLRENHLALIQWLAVNYSKQFSTVKI